MQSAPDQMYRPEQDLSMERKFTNSATNVELQSDQVFIEYDERAIGGSGKYDLFNIPDGFEIEDESEMFEEAGQDQNMVNNIVNKCREFVDEKIEIQSEMSLEKEEAYALQAHQ